MPQVLKNICIRGIVNSTGGYSVEADACLDTGYTGRASVPIALAPGRREVVGIELDLQLGRLTTFDAALASVLLNESTAQDQHSLDAQLLELTQSRLVPPAVALAVSIAYARAVADERRCRVWEYVQELSGLETRVPSPIVNIFSGGIHAPHRLAFQNVLAVPRTGDVPDQLAAAIDLYFYARNEAAGLDLVEGISPSGGIILRTSDERYALDLLARCIKEMRAEDVLGMGIDVAAEHLTSGPGRYRLAGKYLAADAFLERLIALQADFSLTYLEDPFDAEDTDHWHDITQAVSGKALIVADDLFATNAALIVPGAATGIVIKPAQVGTISGAIKAARCAAEHGMQLVTLHRSVETEDTFVSDLSIGLGAAFQKMGGPIGSDRTAKMNVQIRAFEEV